MATAVLEAVAAAVLWAVLLAVAAAVFDAEALAVAAAVLEAVAEAVLEAVAFAVADAFAFAVAAAVLEAVAAAVVCAVCDAVFDAAARAPAAAVFDAEDAAVFAAVVLADAAALTLAGVLTAAPGGWDDQRMSVLITCSRPVFYKDAILGPRCPLPYGHAEICDDGGYRPFGKRVNPDPPVWDDRPPRLWLLDLEDRWPVLAHLVVSSEPGPAGQVAAHMTSCGKRWRPYPYSSAELQSLQYTIGDDLPLQDRWIHCGGH